MNPKLSINHLLQIHHHKYWDQLEGSVEGSSFEGLGEFVDWNQPTSQTGPVIGVIEKPSPSKPEPVYPKPPVVPAVPGFPEYPGVPAVPGFPQFPGDSNNYDNNDDLAILQGQDQSPSKPSKPVAPPNIPPFDFFPTSPTTTTRRTTTTTTTTTRVPTYATEPVPYPDKITSDVPAVKTGVAVALPSFMLLFALGVLFSLFSNKKSNQVTPPGKKGSGICGINSVTDPNNPNYGKWDHEMAPDQLKPELFSPAEIRKFLCRCQVLCNTFSGCPNEWSCDGVYT